MSDEADQRGLKDDAFNALLVFFNTHRDLASPEEVEKVRDRLRPLGRHILEHGALGRPCECGRPSRSECPDAGKPGPHSAPKACGFYKHPFRIDPPGCSKPSLCTCGQGSCMGDCPEAKTNCAPPEPVLSKPGCPFQYCDAPEICGKRTGCRYE